MEKNCHLLGLTGNVTRVLKLVTELINTLKESIVLVKVESKHVSSENVIIVENRNSRVSTVDRKKRMLAKGRKLHYMIRKGMGSKATHNTNTDTDSEFLLIAVNILTFGATDTLINEPNIYIADSSGASDTTVQKVGISNKKIVSARDNMLMLQEIIEFLKKGQFWVRSYLGQTFFRFF